MADFLTVLGMPASWVLSMVDAVLGKVSWFGVPHPSSGWTLPVAGVLLRAVLVPLWSRALRGQRTYLVAIPHLIRRDFDRAQASDGDFRLLSQAAYALVSVGVFGSFLALLSSLALGAEPDGGHLVSLTAPWLDWGIGASSMVWQSSTLRAIGGSMGLAALAVFMWYSLLKTKRKAFMPESVWRRGPYATARGKVFAIGGAFLVLVVGSPVGFTAVLLGWLGSGDVLAMILVSSQGPVVAPR